MAEIVVADASPIIALARIEQLELLSRVFSRAILPLSVYRETQRRPELSDAQSHCGVFMDEKAGRAAARVLGLKTIGTLGVLSLARSKGFVTELKPPITRLQQCGYYLATDLVESVLRRHGELTQGLP